MWLDERKIIWTVDVCTVLMRSFHLFYYIIFTGFKIAKRWFDFDEFSTDEFDINLIPFQIKFIHLSIMIWYNFFNSRSECIMPYDFS